MPLGELLTPKHRITPATAVVNAPPASVSATLASSCRTARPCGQGCQLHYESSSRSSSSGHQRGLNCDSANRELSGAAAITASSESAPTRPPPLLSSGRLRVIVRLRPSVNLAEGPSGLVAEEKLGRLHVPMEECDDSRVFTFDAVHGPQSSQEAIYNQVKEAVTMALGGGCGGVLCYGGSKSGRTHTLVNLHIGEWGVLPLALHEVCTTTHEKGGAVEVACGHINDELLSDLLREDDSSARTAGLAGVETNMKTAAAVATTVAHEGVASSGGSLLEQLSWQQCDSSREGMLMMRRAVRARMARALESRTACDHLIVLLRVNLTSGSAESPSKRGLLYVVDMAESVETQYTVFSLTEAPADHSTDCFRRWVLALASAGAGSSCNTAQALTSSYAASNGSDGAGSAAGENPQTTTQLPGSTQICSPEDMLRPEAKIHSSALMHDSTLTTLLHELGAFMQGARPVLIVCIAPGKDDATISLASLCFAEAAMYARLVPPESSVAQGIVVHLRRQLASSVARIAFHAAKSKELENEVAALRAKVAAQGVDVVEALCRASEASQILAHEHGHQEDFMFAKMDLTCGPENRLHAEFASEARVLGLLCRQEGDGEAAVRFHQRARRLHIAAVGAAHREVARDCCDLGNALCDLGRLDEAAVAYTNALEIDREALGTEHVDTAVDIGSLGMVLAVQKRWEEALPLLHQAQCVLVSRLEPQAPNLVAINRFCHETLERVQHACREVGHDKHHRTGTQKVSITRATKKGAL